jgi:hypothetical protein
VGPKDEGPAGTIRSGGTVQFKNCTDCGISNLVFMDGARQRTAPGPAIAVQNSTVTIEDCEIVAKVRDGIVLGSGAHADIHNNYIDGGGAGIRINGQSSARIQRNWIRRSQNGVVIFDSSADEMDVVVSGNIIEEIRNTGIAIQVAAAVVERNVVYACGGPGIRVTRDTPPLTDGTLGRITENIVVHTGSGDPHPGVDSFDIRGNTFYDNRSVPGDPLSGDTTREMFWRGRRGWVRTYRNTRVGLDHAHRCDTGTGASDMMHRFYESAFLTRYSRWGQ